MLCGPATSRHLARSLNKPLYTRERNAELDEDFNIAEVIAVLHRLNSKSAPGPNSITNKTLRNLDISWGRFPPLPHLTSAP